jgi:hypothetical protein
MNAAVPRRRERKSRGSDAKRRRRAYARNTSDLAAREPAVWKEIGALVATKQPASYDRAVALLADLKEIAVAHKQDTNFKQRLHVLCAEHHRKPSFILKLRRAGLALP